MEISKPYKSGLPHPITLPVSLTTAVVALWCCPLLPSSSGVYQGV